MKKQQQEIWKSIPEFYGYYECSDHGRVRSLDRITIDKNGQVRKLKGKVKKPGLSGSGYLGISLNRDGKIKGYGIHKLVAMCFLNHIPDGHNTEVDHIDNDPLNNCLSNLQVISQRENASKDRWRHNYSSKAIGVHWCKRDKIWMSHIRIDNKQIHLGIYESQLKASEAYEIALAFIDRYDGDNTKFRNFIKSKI